MVILNQNVTIHTHWSVTFCIRPKSSTQKSSEFFPGLELLWLVQNSTVMAVAAILRNRLLKMATKRKLNKSLYWVEVASKNGHAVSTQEYTSTGMKI